MLVRTSVCTSRCPCVYQCALVQHVYQCVLVCNRFATVCQHVYEVCAGVCARLSIARVLLCISMQQYVLDIILCVPTYASLYEVLLCEYQLCTFLCVSMSTSQCATGCQGIVECASHVNVSWWVYSVCSTSHPCLYQCGLVCVCSCVLMVTQNKKEGLHHIYHYGSIPVRMPCVHMMSQRTTQLESPQPGVLRWAMGLGVKAEVEAVRKKKIREGGSQAIRDA